MSLLCYLCNGLIGFSDRLPGREGLLVHPINPTLIYKPDIKGYILGYTTSEENMSICLKCVEDKVPNDKRKRLNAIYDAYEAETEYMKKESERLKLNQPNTFNTSAWKEFKSAEEEVPKDCLWCEKNPRNGNPYFHARLIDRIKSPKNSGFFGQTYQIFGNIETGMVNFYICFDDFKERFNPVFKQLSYDMLKKKNPDFQPFDQLYIDPSVEEAVKADGGDIDKMLKKMFKDHKGNIRIIRKST